MMHSTLHFAVGLAVIMACRAPGFLARIRRRAPLHRHLGLTLLLAHAAGLWSIAPNLLRRAGLPDAMCEHPVMNVFFLSPLFNRWIDGGTVYGPAVLTALIALQYVTLLWALRRATPAERGCAPRRGR